MACLHLKSVAFRVYGVQCLMGWGKGGPIGRFQGVRSLTALWHCFNGSPAGKHALFGTLYEFCSIARKTE